MSCYSLCLDSNWNYVGSICMVSVHRYQYFYIVTVDFELSLGAVDIICL